MINRSIEANKVSYVINGQARSVMIYGRRSRGWITDHLSRELGVDILVTDVETTIKKYEVDEQKFIKIAKELI